MSGDGASFSLSGAVVRDHNNRKFGKQVSLLPRTFILPVAKIRLLETEVVSSWPANEFEAASQW
jgi:hypothetical protein